MGHTRSPLCTRPTATCELGRAPGGAPIFAALLNLAAGGSLPTAPTSHQLRPLVDAIATLGARVDALAAENVALKQRMVALESIGTTRDTTRATTAASIAASGEAAAAQAVAEHPSERRLSHVESQSREYVVVPAMQVHEFINGHACQHTASGAKRNLPIDAAGAHTFDWRRRQTRRRTRAASAALSVPVTAVTPATASSEPVPASSLAPAAHAVLLGGR